MIEFRNVNKTYDTGTKAVKNANFIIDNLHLSSLDPFEYYREIIFTTPVLLSNLRFIWQVNE